MKTDEEMIKSLYKRREEYYARTAKKSFAIAVIKAVMGTAVPIAAAGAAAFFLILAQKNIAPQDDMSGGETTDIAPASAGDNGENTKKSEASEKLTSSPPLCFSFGGQIYGAAEEQGEFFTEYAASNLTEAGTAAVLETEAEERECIVYKLEDSDLKALKTEEGTVFYRPIGKSSYTVSGWEFEITALHKTAERYKTTALPIFREGEDIVFRAYDGNGRPVRDVFMLYTPELLDFDSVLWEVKGNLPENTRELDNYPAPEFIQYFSLVRLCERIRSDGFKADGVIAEYGCNTDIVIDGKLVAKGIQLYYTDLNYTEYVLEAYEHSDEIAITRLATGESVFITDDICDYREFLNPDTVPETVKGEGVITADKVSRMWEKHVRGAAEGNGLTEREIIGAGFKKSEEAEDKYELYYTFNGREYIAEAYIDEGTGNVVIFTAYEGQFVEDGSGENDLVNDLDFIKYD